MSKVKIIETTNDYTVCIKPSGISSEDGKSGGMPTLLSKKGDKPFVVHRLDKEVAGLMVFANNSVSAAELSRQVAEKTFEKQYLAVVEGMTDEQGVLEDLLFHDRMKNKTYTVKNERKGVKFAKLSFERIATAETLDGVLSLLRIRLFTGRTHQIRVQFASRRLPLWGDRRYGSANNGKIALFSALIGFEHKGERKEFTALPESEFPWSLFSEKLL